MRENRPPLRVPRRPRMLIEPLFHARHPSPPTENAAVSGAHGETFSPCVSHGGGTASRRRRERRSKALWNFGLAIPATERQATAHCSVRGRAGACRRGRRARRRGGSRRTDRTQGNEDAFPVTIYAPMTASPTTVSPALLPIDVTELIEQKNFDALEDVWTKRMEEEPEDLPFFFAVASAMKKKGGGAPALSWLRFLADYEAERGDGDRQLAVLLEIARMSPTDEEIRSELD